jgi:hypothetical protein
MKSVSLNFWTFCMTICCLRLFASIYRLLPAGLWPWYWLSLQMSIRNLPGVKSDRSVRLKTSPSYVRRLSGKFDILDVLQPCRHPWPVIGTALLTFLLYYMIIKIIIREFCNNEWRILYKRPAMDPPSLFLFEYVRRKANSVITESNSSLNPTGREEWYIYHTQRTHRSDWGGKPYPIFPSESSSRVSRTRGSASPSELKQASVCTCKLPRLWVCQLEHRWLTVVRKSNRNKTLTRVSRQTFIAVFAFVVAIGLSVNFVRIRAKRTQRKTKCICYSEEINICRQSESCKFVFEISY